MTIDRFVSENSDKIIYSLMLFENLNFTYEQIVLFNANENTSENYECQILCDAIDAWQYTLDNLGFKITLEYLIKLNELLVRHQAIKVGSLRDAKGGFVFGSSYEPQIPNKLSVEGKISEFLISNSNNLVEESLEYFCYASKEQLFFDGNKRTALLIVNKVLIENEIGLFIIDDKNKEEFNMHLNNHYNLSHNDESYKTKFITYCINNCIEYV